MGKLKLVKKAHLEKTGESFKVIHYDTVIFEYDTTTKIAKTLKDCSTTSNRQIRYAVAYFEPEKVIEEKNPRGKWSYSGPITQ